MASFNKVILLGNLTRDPEVRYTPKGTAVTELGMAVNRVYTAENGEKRELSLAQFRSNSTTRPCSAR